MTEIFYISLLAFFATGVGTIAGFGGSTIMIPVLLFFYPFPIALFLAGAIHWIGDIWDVILFRKQINWGLVIKFGLPGIIAAMIGAYLVFALPITFLSRALGLFLITYAAILFYKRSSPSMPRTKFTETAGGTTSGFLAGALGIGGPIKSIFLNALSLEKEAYVATAAAVAMFVDTTRLIAYTQKGIMPETELLFGFLLFIPASFLGAEAAKKIVHRMGSSAFHQILALFLFAAGAKFLLLP